MLGHLAQRCRGGLQGSERRRYCSQDIRDAQRGLGGHMAPASSYAWWSRCCPEGDLVLAQVGLGSGLWQPGAGRSWRRRVWGCVALRGAGGEMPDFLRSFCRDLPADKSRGHMGGGLAGGGAGMKGDGGSTVGLGGSLCHLEAAEGL